MEIDCKLLVRSLFLLLNDFSDGIKFLFIFFCREKIICSSKILFRFFFISEFQVKIAKLKISPIIARMVFNKSLYHLLCFVYVLSVP